MLADDRPPAQPVITVWQVVPVPAAGGAREALGSAERRHAASLPPARQPLYVAARRMLRATLGALLGVAPDRVRLAQVCPGCGGFNHGKLRVLDSRGALDCSVAYGVDLALVAVARGCRVGVDLEDLVEGTAVHRWCFDEIERRQLSGLAPGVRREAVTAAWARKEAVAKADGRGLELPLSAVRATGPPSSWSVPEPWRVLDLDVGAGRRGALAHDAPEVAVELVPAGSARLALARSGP